MLYVNLPGFKQYLVPKTYTGSLVQNLVVERYRFISPSNNTPIPIAKKIREKGADISVIPLKDKCLCGKWTF